MLGPLCLQERNWCVIVVEVFGGMSMVAWYLTACCCCCIMLHGTVWVG